jgi:hypothetical protein
VSDAAPPPPPGGVLVQSVYTTGEGVASGWRVWEDGRHESRVGGGDWVPVGRLGPGSVAAARAALEGAGLDGIAGPHRPPGARPDGGDLWFQAALADGPVAVGLLAGAGSPELDALMAVLGPILVTGVS